MLTKLDKAKVIIQALHNLKELPEEGKTTEYIWKQVKKRSRLDMRTIDYQYELAIKVLKQK